MAIEHIADQIQVTTPEAVLSIDVTQKMGWTCMFIRTKNTLNPILAGIEIPNDQMQTLVDTLRDSGWIR
jgi:hypothetical protein